MNDAPVRVIEKIGEVRFPKVLSGTPPRRCCLTCKYMAASRLLLGAGRVCRCEKSRYLGKAMSMRHVCKQYERWKPK